MKSGCFAKAVFFLFVAASVHAATRVALMDFSVDDNSYRSAQAAADFSSLVQIQMADQPEVQWVERAQLKRIKDELNLSALEGLGGDSSLRQGKLAMADWMITGQFSLDDHNRHTLFIEIVDLQHADVLASRTVVLQENTQIGLNTNQIAATATALRELLVEAHSRNIEMAGKTLIAPLFFADVTEWGGFGPFRNSGGLEENFNDSLARQTAGNSSVQLVHFPKAYRSTEESEMVLDGLVATDKNAWQQTADLYVWGTYTTARRTAPGKRPDEALELTLHIWDGASKPIDITEKLPPTATPSDVQNVLDRFAKDTITHANRHATHIGSESFRKGIAASLVDIYDQMTLISHHREDLGLHNPEKFLQAAHMLETACFFDPDNAKARVLYITCRWGWWMDFGFTVKNQFWSKWRRSRAWGDYVARFGLEPVAVELPFPYQQQGGITNIYMRSIGDALEMFPRWRSVDDMNAEDEDRKRGVYTTLAGAELHGFPKDMPHELAMKWETDTEAELTQRQKKVAEYTRAMASRTNSSDASSNNLSGNVSNQTKLVSRTAPVPGQNRPSPPPHAHTPPQMVPTPSWLRQINPTFSMFRLFPPKVLPVEVKPTVQEIRFPDQFEVQSIHQMGFVQDKLLILAMDQRSAQSSDANPDLSAEMLDKHNRLWVLEAGTTNPVLYEPGLFPSGATAFLEADNHLWVAGKTTGYLDLKTGKFRKFGFPDGFTFKNSESICSAADRIFIAGDTFGLCMFDPVSDTWTNLVLPRANLSAGGDSPPQLAGQKERIAYVAGNALIYDFRHRIWTNLSSMGPTEQVAADETGFWFGGWSGLSSYVPESETIKKWAGPGMINSLVNPISTSGLSDMGNNTISQENLDRMDHQIQGLIQKLLKDRAQTHAAKLEKKKPLDPLNLNCRVPGEVGAMANDGDFLWLGVENYFGNYLLLLHKPSHSLVSCFVMPVRDRISSLVVSKTAVWAGTAYGDNLLFRISKDAFLSVPKSQWVNLTISPEERARSIGNMSIRDQAVYAFYSADDARVAELLGNTNPAKATLEEIFLLAFSYDTSGLDKPELARFWFEHIISRDPESPWAKAAERALSENDHNHSVKAHQAALVEWFDLNHDGVLDEKETARMKQDPGYQREQKAFDDVETDVQIKAIFERYDSDKNNKLDNSELSSLVSTIRAYSDAPPEMIAGRKILVAPLLAKNFPTAPVLLNKYDSDHNDALNLDELRALARDLKQQ